MNTETSSINLETEFTNDLQRQSFLTRCANEEQGYLNEYDGIDCPLCHNKGFIITDDDNEVTTTHHECTCMKKRKAFKLAKESGLDELLKHRIKNYKVTNEWQKAIRNLAIEYIQNNPFKNWFCLLGQSGAGKTHICSSICNALIDNGKAVLYMQWNDFVSSYKDKFGKEQESSRELLKTYQNIEVLYIDDLFKGSSNTYDVKNIAFDLINYRYNNDLVTIISCESDFEELNNIDSAIAGRIKEKCSSFLAIIPKDIKNNYRIKGGK